MQKSISDPNLPSFENLLERQKKQIEENEKEIASLRQIKEDLERLLKEKELLVRDVRHRVKNNLQVISSLLNIQSEYVKDEEAQKLFLNSLNRIRTMSMVYEAHYQSMDAPGIDIDKYLKDIVIYLYRSNNINPTLIKLDIDLAPISMSMETSITCGLLINEIISNAFKHAFPDGKAGNVQLIFIKSELQNKLIISDDGIGFTENLDFESNDTFGLLLIRTLVDQLNGTVEVIKTNGIKYIIDFPGNS
jgi:two-component sensor histidine kinase